MSQEALFVERAAEVAAKRLGYASLKPKQLEVIKKVALGKDVFAVLPTGFGKSLCYACLPWVFDELHGQAAESPSIVIVVSPLTAIMTDQVASLSARGLSVACVIGSSSDVVKAGVKNGLYQLVFFTPEVLITNKQWRQLLTEDNYSQRVSAFVVDEAHVVKKWGDTFREVLKRVGEIRSLLPRGTPVMALTATATVQLRLKIADILGMRAPSIVAVSPCKENVMYAVSDYESIPVTFYPLLDRIKKERITAPRDIIYCRRFKECADLYHFFQTGLGDGFTEPRDAPDLSKYRLVEMYSSCTEDRIREQIVKNFSTVSSPLRVVCATVAFGMGIDCPDVRQVIHIGAPEDIEGYIQETGRAGRDGKPCAALLLRNKKVCNVNQSMKEYQENFVRCRRDFLFRETDNYIHQDLGSLCSCCDICAKKCPCSRCYEKLGQFVMLNI